MPIHFSPGFKEIWNESTTKLKLCEIANAKKETHWIHANLSVSESNCPSRCLWSLVAKRFDSLRQLYFINTNLAAASLSRLGNEIEGHPEMYGLFLQASSNFTAITNHAVEQPYWSRHFLNQQTVPIVPVEVPKPMPEPTPYVIVNQEPPVVVHEVHQHHHSVPVVVHHPVPLPSPGYVAPCHVRPSPAISRTPVVTPGGREIPGSGRGEAIRNVPPVVREGIVNHPPAVQQPMHNKQVPPQAAKRAVVVPRVAHQAHVRPQEQVHAGRHVPVGARH